MKDKELQDKVEKEIEEACVITVAGLSLTRAISPDDIRWATGIGFWRGLKFKEKQKNEDKNGSI